MKDMKGITHHVPLRQMIYSKKQIGWKHIESIDNKTETQSVKHRVKSNLFVERVPVHYLVTLVERKGSVCHVSWVVYYKWIKREI